MNTTAQRRRTRNERTPTKLARRPDAGGALALYQQVKEFITARIQDGSWPPGHRLPSENELVAQFGVSRMTVNRAFRELMDHGRVVRVAGVGSFVAEARPQSTLLRIANLGEEIRRRGHEYECRLLLLQRASASLEIATSLDLATGESVYHSVCVHLENGVPVQLEDRYVSPRMAPDFIKQDFRRTSPSEHLLRSVPLDEIEHVVDAVLPTPEQADRLEMPVTQPCLLLTRRTWSRGRPVTLVRCLHPAARYRLGSRFRTEGQPASG
ncbi:MAG: histidine utilization repressor [Steroidobacteraceae bacterium]|jgi:GntR family histidine utilization transcriptional repressor|nr:histidine utilization repressor [Steroidobacteraceae bacterium]